MQKMEDPVGVRGWVRVDVIEELKGAPVRGGSVWL